MISNFDTKTIRVSSSPATLSYLTRCLGSLYGDAGERVRNEEKGTGEGKLQKDRYGRGSEDETENEGGGDEDGKGETERMKARKSERDRSKAQDTLSEFKANTVTMFRICAARCTVQGIEFATYVHACTPLGRARLCLF